jgi:hypothetical protein
MIVHEPPPAPIAGIKEKSGFVRLSHLHNTEGSRRTKTNRFDCIFDFDRMLDLNHKIRGDDRHAMNGVHVLDYRPCNLLPVHPGHLE